MAQLESSWSLEEQLRNIECSGELKTEILTFIDRNHGGSTGQKMSARNLYYRSNLHYIVDNIAKPSLIDEIKVRNALPIVP